MGNARLGLVILAVTDLARSVRFWRETFGFPAAVEVPVYVELLLPGGMRLGLYEQRGFGRNTGEPPALAPPGRVAGAELYLYPEELEGTLDAALRAGARLLSPLAPRDWGDEAAYLADPDGWVVVLARPLPAAD